MNKINLSRGDQSGIFLKFQVIKFVSLKESGKIFREFCDNCLTGVFITKPSGEILYANKQIISMLGYENLDELKQRNLEEE